PRAAGAAPKRRPNRRRAPHRRRHAIVRQRMVPRAGGHCRALGRVTADDRGGVPSGAADPPIARPRLPPAPRPRLPVRAPIAGPPANSYDLSVMTEFSDAVQQAIGSDVRAVIVRSASVKFFSAGADVKKFLDGDVDSTMEMIRVSQAAFRRMAAAEQIFIA